MNATGALVRSLPDSFDSALQIEKVKINMKKAKSQHDNYHHVLQKYVQLTELDNLPDYPDSCFVEDICIVVGKRAVINNLGAESRKGEAKSGEKALRALGYEVAVMPSNMTCDGGDVLYTGNNLFLGLSARTSKEAVDFLSKHLQIPAYGIKVHHTILHLKSVLGLLGPNVLSCWDSEAGRMMVNQILKIEKMEVVFTPSQILSNSLSFITKGKLIVFIQVTPETQKFQKDLLKLLPDAIIEQVDMSELALADGALTCCSVLLQ